MRFDESPWMAEPFLSVLGATEVTAMDASPYEGAQIVHNLNFPVPEHLHERFTLVFDGGSLEHVFNVPVAISSYMQLVEVGGHIIVTTTANNFLGHGLYQFSPEFFFRVFAPENGFTVERCVAMENYVALQSFMGRGIPFESDGRWYDVSDPAVLGRRVLLENSRPVLLTVQARRTHRASVDARGVHQSDYLSRWTSDATQEADTNSEVTRNPSALGRLLEAIARKHLPIDRRMTLALDVLPRALPFLNPFWFHREQRTRSFRDRDAYRPIPRGKRRSP